MNNDKPGLGVSGVLLIGLLVLAAAVGSVSYALQRNQIDKLQSQVSAQASDLQNKQNPEASNIQTDKFQAVFMNTSTNGSAYLGKLSLVSANEYKLTDIYYLSNAGALVKLGDEPHKPQDAMYIPRSSVEFWENLKDANQFNGQLK